MAQVIKGAEVAKQISEELEEMAERLGEDEKGNNKNDEDKVIDQAILDAWIRGTSKKGLREIAEERHLARGRKKNGVQVPSQNLGEPAKNNAYKVGELVAVKWEGKLKWEDEVDHKNKWWYAIVIGQIECQAGGTSGYRIVWKWYDPTGDPTPSYDPIKGDLSKKMRRVKGVTLDDKGNIIYV